MLAQAAHRGRIEGHDTSGRLRLRFRVPHRVLGGDERAPHREPPGVQVNVGPLEPERFATPEPGGQ
jgi:hypothetical protein